MLMKRLWALWAVCLCSLFVSLSARAEIPNVIFIVADDLGYGDLGCYGQTKIKTPHLDKLAAEGTRFTNFYAGSTVCAPSRGSLMTGKHTGHATIRGNKGIRPTEVPLSEEETALPQIFKDAGYKTVMFGKWGVGENNSSGAPLNKGFDTFVGYLTQQAAHDYYPEWIWRNKEKYPLTANAGGAKGTYTHDLFLSEAQKWIRFHHRSPFFVYLPVTIPHANNEEKPNGQQVPDDEPYSEEEWPQTEKNFAAMITRLDSGVGQIMALLKELKIDDTTLVIFTSDNGPHSEGGHKADFFDSNGALRGIKRDLYEGGIRVPLIMRWPGYIKEGVVSDQIWAFWDVLPTVADLIEQPMPNEMDGVSVVPALLDGKKVPHPPLYWEFHEGGFKQAARDGNWKAVKNGLRGTTELYDLSNDPGETKNVAEANPAVLQRLDAFLRGARTESQFWPLPQSNAPVNNNGVRQARR